jgi:hypothetical protein
MNIYQDLYKLSKTQLVETSYRLAWNKEFGCFTKNGFAELIWPEISQYARYIVYFDIDYLKKHNDQYDTFAPVNAMIKQALSVLRRDDAVAGQVNSGDELLACMIERPNDDSGPSERRQTLDPEALKARLMEGLTSVGMSATFAIVEVKSWDLEEVLAPAIAEVKALKKARGITR